MLENASKAGWDPLGGPSIRIAGATPFLHIFKSLEVSI
jgi:hypothetical protein